MLDVFGSFVGVVGEGEGGGDCGVDVWEDVGDDVHLVDALEEDFAFVVVPLEGGEVAVDWFGHVACIT